ncbi:hypothetical protein [Amaricoccus tamworthensis]|uniref:hypothetical protein n=1 Tax=Amaricoccus tamworthensis TaxID=57002 RepID=UPI003C7B8558
MNHSHDRGGGSRFLYEPFQPSSQPLSCKHQDMLDKMVPAEEIREKFREIDVLLEERNRRIWLFQTIKAVAAWAMVVSAGWMALRGVAWDFLKGIQQ